MATEKSTAPGAARCLTTYDGDDREQWAVLHQVMDLHPEALTRDELIREMAAGSKDFRAVDPIERAVRDLVATGLLHPLGDGEMIRPTRPAVHYYELSGGAF
jgi:hypothetical protein